MKKLLLIFILNSSLLSNLLSQELIIGKEIIKPGIVAIFEGAIKDMVFPLSNNLKENETNVHIEARVNWNNKNTPKGSPAGGFIPYLVINCLIKNQSSNLKTFIDLIPHINLIDNFHYARNISLPGKINDLYTVEFAINPPSRYSLSFHKDWIEKYNKALIKPMKYVYRDINFKQIAEASR